MAITIKQFFPFRQINVQDNKGWCAGISIAFIAHLYRNRDRSGQSYIRPEVAYQEAEIYMNRLSNSYDKPTKTVTPGEEAWRKYIYKLQVPYNYDMLDEGKLKGTYEYNFHTDEPGCAFLRLYVHKVTDTYTNYFQSWYTSSFFSGSGNHAGVVIWYPHKDTFLFDPNCGGALIEWTKDTEDNSFTSMVDHALTEMYRMNDRKKGKRTAQIISALKPDLAKLPYYE